MDCNVIWFTLTNRELRGRKGLEAGKEFARLHLILITLHTCGKSLVESVESSALPALFKYTGFPPEPLV